MAKSILYAVNTVTQSTVADGTVVNFGTIVRRYGCNCNLSGGNAELTGSGYYDIDTNFSITPTAAGTVSLAIYNDGVLVPGAEAIFDVASSVTYAVTIPAIIRNTCNCAKTITVVASGVATSINNAAISVEKL